MQKLITTLAILLAFALSAPVSAQQVTIGYQGICNPWKWKIDTGAFEEATGYDISWRKFDSGSAVISAMAAGDVDIAMAGSSPIAAGISGPSLEVQLILPLGITWKVSGISDNQPSLDVQLFWITENIASAEALVVRDGSGITAPQDLYGKTIGVPFISTTHFHLLFALEQFGIDADDVDIVDMQPQEIAQAWESGEIDAAFVWDPALGKIKKSGEVLITSGQLSAWGKATFDGMVVNRNWGRANRDFMVEFVKVIADADADYRTNPGTWSPSSDKVRSLVKLAGCTAKDVPDILALYHFPSLKEQASARWLGGGENSGAARALRFTSEFLKDEKKVQVVHDDYSRFVTDEYVLAAQNR